MGTQVQAERWRTFFSEECFSYHSYHWQVPKCHARMWSPCPGIHFWVFNTCTLKLFHLCKYLMEVGVVRWCPIGAVRLASRFVWATLTFMLIKRAQISMQIGPHTNTSQFLPLHSVPNIFGIFANSTRCIYQGYIKARNGQPFRTNSSVYPSH